ncbi:hypothetical protein EUGRSUZ_C02201 [Eucalyptus grandis]|uniref:Uncharacterized protein n=2 Tax=Eucalyptus grandis TaxID=71139 RepID=A0ACC3LGY5_EUCGR|nr:hypothetical protein EUGRSUZ_C02201 [Eucalyptus grandis]
MSRRLWSARALSFSFFLLCPNLAPRPSSMAVVTFVGDALQISRSGHPRRNAFRLRGRRTVEDLVEDKQTHKGRQTQRRTEEDEAEDQI